MNKILTRKAVDKKTCGKFKTKISGFGAEIKLKELEREVVRVYWINLAWDRVV
jgi:hypothetical protein